MAGRPRMPATNIERPVTSTSRSTYQLSSGDILIGSVYSVRVSRRVAPGGQIGGEHVDAVRLGRVADADGLLAVAGEPTELAGAGGDGVEQDLTGMVRDPGWKGWSSGAGLKRRKTSVSSYRGTKRLAGGRSRVEHQATDVAELVDPRRREEDRAPAQGHAVRAEAQLPHAATGPGPVGGDVPADGEDLRGLRRRTRRWPTGAARQSSTFVPTSARRPSGKGCGWSKGSFRPAWFSAGTPWVRHFHALAVGEGSASSS